MPFSAPWRCSGGLGERNAGTSPENRIEFRVGINLGDVIAEAEVATPITPSPKMSLRA
jgi:hypothetical protein